MKFKYNYEEGNALYNRLATARQIFLILYFALLLVHLHKNATKRTLRWEISNSAVIHYTFSCIIN